MVQNKPKRSSPRFEHGNLVVRVKQTGFFSRFHSETTVSWLDYHKQGIAFVSDKKYAIDSTLKLSMSISDEYRVDVKDIVALVRNRQKKQEGYRYGLEFDFDSDSHMRSSHVQSDLVKIEELLKSIYLRLTGKSEYPRVKVEY